MENNEIISLLEMLNSSDPSNHELALGIIKNNKPTHEQMCILIAYTDYTAYSKVHKLYHTMFNTERIKFQTKYNMNQFGYNKLINYFNSNQYTSYEDLLDKITVK